MTMRGKPRWSIVRGDFRAVQKRRGDRPEVFEGEPPPHHADSRVVEQGSWALRVGDGSWRIFETKKEAESFRRQNRVRAAPGAELAERLEAKVRLSLKGARAGTRVAVSTINDNVLSSYLEPGRTTGLDLTSGALRPSPQRVYVFTESGGLRDPVDYPDIRQMFDRAVDALDADPWVVDAGWESYNAAIQYFWVDPLLT